MYTSTNTNSSVSSNDEGYSNSNASSSRNSDRGALTVFLVCCYIPIVMSLFDLLLVRYSYIKKAKLSLFICRYTRHLPLASLSLVFLSFLFQLRGVMIPSGSVDLSMETNNNTNNNTSSSDGGYDEQQKQQQQPFWWRWEDVSEEQWLLVGFISTFLFVLWRRDRYYDAYNVNANRRIQSSDTNNNNNNMGRIVSNTSIRSSTLSLSSSVANERDWPDWNTSDTLDWIQSNVLLRLRSNMEETHTSSSPISPITMPTNTHANSNYNDDEERDTHEEILELLRIQRINGKALAYMTVERLCSMGLSFGDAVHLYSNIHALMKRYPDTGRTSSTNTGSRSHGRSYTSTAGGSYTSSSGGGAYSYDTAADEVRIDLDAWLGKKKDPVIPPTNKDPIQIQTNPMNDVTYSRDNSTSIVDSGAGTQHYQQHVPRNDFDLINDRNRTITPTTAAPKFESAMDLSDRIGIEMPFSEEDTSIIDSEQSFMSHHSRTHRHPNHHPSNVHVSEGTGAGNTTPLCNGVAGNATTTTTTIDAKILEQLPPNIREIAIRQPQLVQQMLLNKLKSSTSASSRPASAAAATTTTLATTEERVEDTLGRERFNLSTPVAGGIPEHEHSTRINHSSTKKVVSFALDANNPQVDDESVGEEMVGLLRKRRS